MDARRFVRQREPRFNDCTLVLFSVSGVAALCEEYASGKMAQLTEERPALHRGPGALIRLLCAGATTAKAGS